MGFAYYDYYTTPIMSYVNYPLIMAIAMVIAAIIGLVLYFVFLKRSNEGRFHGFKKAMYNLLAFNRFYAENIIKFVYVIAACIVTVAGIVMIVLGSFMSGIVMLIIVNIILRVAAELVLMFIMLCKKTVSMDRRLAKIEDFYMENYGDDWGEESGSGCGGCGDFGDEEEDEFGEDCDFDREGCSGCAGYSQCSSAADEECSKCGSWSALEELCICTDECDSCEKKDTPVEG